MDDRKADDAAEDFRLFTEHLKKTTRCVGGPPNTLLPTLQRLRRDIQHLSKHSLGHGDLSPNFSQRFGINFRGRIRHLDGSKREFAFGVGNAFFQPILQARKQWRSFLCVHDFLPFFTNALVRRFNADCASARSSWTTNSFHDPGNSIPLSGIKKGESAQAIPYHFEVCTADEHLLQSIPHCGWLISILFP